MKLLGFLPRKSLKMAAASPYWPCAKRARPPEFFYVGGEIQSPGQKSFHAGMTLTQAVLASGGVTAQAGPRVRVLRQGADGRLVASEYNLREIEGGAAPDPTLQPGDRIEVTRARK